MEKFSKVNEGFDFEKVYLEELNEAFPNASVSIMLHENVKIPFVQSRKGADLVLFRIDGYKKGGSDSDLRDIRMEGVFRNGVCVSATMQMGGAGEKPVVFENLYIDYNDYMTYGESLKQVVSKLRAKVER